MGDLDTRRSIAVHFFAAGSRWRTPLKQNRLHLDVHRSSCAFKTPVTEMAAAPLAPNPVSAGASLLTERILPRLAFAALLRHRGVRLSVGRVFQIGVGRACRDGIPPSPAPPHPLFHFSSLFVRRKTPNVLRSEAWPEEEENPQRQSVAKMDGAKSSETLERQGGCDRGRPPPALPEPGQYR
jgi:hypothetical protein